MLIGLFTALMGIFMGGAGPELFYIDKMDKGVKKYVVDKDRKKEMLDSLKVADKGMAKFEKEFDKHVKELLKKNVDRETPEQWFEDFFKKLMNERMVWQEFVADKRIYIQNSLTPEEWEEIINLISEEATKDQDKAKSKANKNSDKLKKAQDKFREALNEGITDETRKADIKASLNDFIDNNKALAEAYVKLNVNESSVIINRQDVSRDQLIKMSNKLNELRTDYYASYITFYMKVRNNTTEEDWKPIIKQFNNLVKK